jgi:hypothetical protein
MLRDASKFTEESQSSHPEHGSDYAGRSGSLQLALGIVNTHKASVQRSAKGGF